MKSRVVRWLLREQGDQSAAHRLVAEMRRSLKLVTEGDEPILIGPWLSEVGYEILYWLPFLRWVLDEFGVPRERNVAVTRGGAAVWYGDVAGRSVDIFDLITIDDYRRRVRERWTERGNQKQMAPGSLDDEILDLVKARLGLSEVRVLHPSIMYRVFWQYWYDKGAYNLIGKHMRFAPLPPLSPDDRVVGALPRDYVAARFYASESFPDTPENRDLARRVIEAVAAEMPVVLLNPALEPDDHVDFEHAGAGVHRIDHLMTPGDNLAVQSRVIAGARALVATSGGLAYLGPAYGVPTVALYSHAEKLLAAHVDVIHRLNRAQRAQLLLLPTGQLDLVRLMLGVAVSRGEFPNHDQT